MAGQITWLIKNERGDRYDNPLMIFYSYSSSCLNLTQTTRADLCRHSSELAERNGGKRGSAFIFLLHTLCETHLPIGKCFRKVTWNLQSYTWYTWRGRLIIIKNKQRTPGYSSFATDLFPHRFWPHFFFVIIYLMRFLRFSNSMNQCKIPKKSDIQRWKTSRSQQAAHFSW